MVKSREAVGLLKDDGVLDEDHLTGVELSPLNVKPAPAAARLKDDGGGNNGPHCGGCGLYMDYSTEIACPGCDSPMHETCGAPVGGNESSPFRLCASCESGHMFQGKKRKKKQNSLLDANASSSVGLRRRPSIDADEGLVSKLMNQPQTSDERDRMLKRRLSKPPATERVPQKVGLLGSDHSVFLAVFLILIMLAFFIFQSITGGLSFGSKPPKATRNQTVIMAEPSDLQAAFQDAWWLGINADDYLNRVYVGKDLKGQLSTLRDIKGITEGLFSPMCGKYRFDSKMMPTVSIVVGPVYAGYTKGLLSMTVHSILARTPPELLHEVVIVHGRLSEEGTQDDDLEWELKQMEHLSNLVKVVAVANMAGPVPARVSAIEKQTSGDILVVMDAYVEVWSSTWLQNLILPIMEYPRTIAVPLLHAMKADRSLEGSADPESYYMSINKRFEIEKVKSTFPGFNQQIPSPWEPHKTPFFEGPVFALRRDQYFKLRELDKGLKRFGGTNIELALKFWMCRGRVIQVPCARAGYIPITEWPLPAIPEKMMRLAGLMKPGDYLYYGEKAEPYTIFLVRNYLRIVRVWFRNHAAKHLFYTSAFGSTKLPPEWAQYEDEMEDDDDWIDTQEIGRDKNKCQDFEWFDKHVLMSILGTHHPWYVRKDAKPH